MSNKTILFVLMAVISVQLHAQRRVLLEHYTSSWCGECPHAHLIAQQIAADHPDRVILAYHHSSADPMANPHSTAWKNAFLIPGTPLGVINRTPAEATGPIYAYTGQWSALVEGQLSEPDYLDLDIQFAPQSEDAPLSFEVSVELLEPLPEAGELRLSVLVVEDSIQSTAPGYQQSNYYNEEEGHPLFGLGGSIQMYPFMNVVRDIIGETWGSSAGLPEQLQVGTSYTWQDYLVLDESWAPEHLRLIVIATLHQEDDFRTRPVLDASEISIGDRLITSTQTETLDLQFEAFPNPVKDWLRLRFPEDEYRFRLLDIQGRVIQTEKIKGNAHQISTDNLSGGMYLIQLIGSDGVSGLKTIVVE
ncbi:MAG: T9SS type A sorting domain-containing protein [Phaeodactylibacter sp.]|uniref:T9SS type A sorting domain-containing protein n=1 Tax=Phaeodactylibacter sp. TaxID=1940289 RepID=UPI0032ECFB84